MTARVLVVDDKLPNIKLLEAKLLQEYFEVITAMSGREALKLIDTKKPDIILLDIMMPSMNGFEVCKKIRENPKTYHIPIIMVTALSSPEDRVKGLEAGADDFITKPINDLALFARVKSLIRLKMLIDEFQARETTSEELGTAGDNSCLTQVSYRNARILLLNDKDFDANRLQDILKTDDNIIVNKEKIHDFETDLIRGDFDLIAIDLSLRSIDGLRIVSQLRSNNETRNLPILLIGDEYEFDRILKGLEIGAIDYVIRPIDGSEFLARARTQIKRKRYQDKLKQNYEDSLTLALIDTLTGAYNRRYVDVHLPRLLERAKKTKKDLSILMFDIDFFKRINDTYGHSVGDDILQEVISRVSGIIRNIDLLARLGGEEFLVILPDSNKEITESIGQRLLTIISENEFSSKDLPETIPLTISVGMAYYNPDRVKDMRTLLKNADEALYKAKKSGRNTLIAHEKSSAA